MLSCPTCLASPGEGPHVVDGGEERGTRPPSLVVIGRSPSSSSASIIEVI